MHLGERTFSWFISKSLTVWKLCGVTWCKILLILYTWLCYKHFPYKSMNVFLSFQPPHLRVKKIFVGGLKPETTDQQIRDYFGSKYAAVRFTCRKLNSWILFCKDVNNHWLQNDFREREWGMASLRLRLGQVRVHIPSKPSLTVTYIHLSCGLY